MRGGTSHRHWSCVHQGGWAPGVITEIVACTCKRKSKSEQRRHIYHVQITFMDGTVTVVEVLPSGDLEAVKLYHLVVTFTPPAPLDPSCSAPLKRKRDDDRDGGHKGHRRGHSTKLLARTHTGK